MTKQVDQAVEPAVKWFLGLLVATILIPTISSAYTIWHEWRDGVSASWYLTIVTVMLLGIWLTLSEEADDREPGISTGGFLTGVALVITVVITLVMLLVGLFTSVSIGDAWSISARFWWGGAVIIATSFVCWVAEKVHLPWLGTPRI